MKAVMSHSPACRLKLIVRSFINTPRDVDNQNLILVTSTHSLNAVQNISDLAAFAAPCCIHLLTKLTEDPAVFSNNDTVLSDRMK